MAPADRDGGASGEGNNPTHRPRDAVGQETLLAQRLNQLIAARVVNAIAEQTQYNRTRHRRLSSIRLGGSLPSVYQYDKAKSPDITHMENG